MASDEGCLFCRIVAGEIPAEVVYDGESTLAFRDVGPQAPTHVLVVPRSHHRDAAELTAAAPGVLVELFRTAAAVADQEGIAEDGYRLVFNTGRAAQQSVPHAHLHVLGGRDLGWPPG